MPPLSPPARILVTGANGYVGCWVVRTLLDRGYAVRALVRTEDKAHVLSALISSKHPSVSASNFDCVVLPDITDEDVICAHLQDIKGIVHTASPVTVDLEDPEDYNKPAIQGTLAILASASKHREIKRVVVTSSVGAIAESFSEKTYLCTEDDWNDFAVEKVRSLGRSASGLWKYDASKVLAERAAWNFYRENKDILPYELSIIAPGWILGPIPDDPPSPDALITPSTRLQWTQVFTPRPPAQSYPPKVFNYVDVRDVVEMHIRALELAEAGGERFISVSHLCTWQDWFDAARDMNLLPGLQRLHPRMDPDERAALDQSPHPVFSNDRAKRTLGMVFRTVSETLRDLVEDFGSRGWLEHLEAVD
ncbi:D-lactaldehyde dehydrogenase [Trametes punicea]|nr:D-lactaldehyde dehydrogenase [Trametes punicea]